MCSSDLLRLESSLERESMLVAVSDTGKGIPPENLDKIFEPFFTSKGRGMGCGLAIVKRIIEDHRGNRSEVRRVGEECSCGRSPAHEAA